jgi:hypothetical protein
VLYVSCSLNTVLPRNKLPQNLCFVLFFFFFDTGVSYNITTDSLTRETKFYIGQAEYKRDEKVTLILIFGKCVQIMDK